MSKAIDLAGQRFGMLQVLKLECVGPRKWRCACQCGRETVVYAHNLRSGGTKSCGCLVRIACARVGRKSLKHGLIDTPEYSSWVHMRTRCSNPRHKNYRHYGGRGIRCCERWNSFENFYADMGPKPSPRHSIERIDNDGHYEPGNCRWATYLEQGQNTSRTRLILHNGCAQTLAAWARDLDISEGALRYRMRTRTPERALTDPLSPSGRRRSAMSCAR